MFFWFFIYMDEQDIQDFSPSRLAPKSDLKRILRLC